MSRLRIDMPAQFLFETNMEVRITDLNYGGHLAHDRTLALMHEARVRFLRQHGFSETDIHGKAIILANAAVTYRTEAFAGEVLRIQIGASEVNKYGCDLLYRLTNQADGREVALARTAMVFFDYTRRRLTTAPPGFAALVAPAGP
jgi:YbgC/YbaW family acyl-CoA thioester hydrolase